MKQRYIDVELIDEYAKKLVLAGSQHMLADQLTILAEQNSRLHYASLPQNRIEYVVTDSPLFLSAFYVPEDYPASFPVLVLDMFRHYDNINIFLERNHPYNPVGRLQTESESDKDAERMKTLLRANNIPFTVMKSWRSCPHDGHGNAGLNHGPRKRSSSRQPALRKVGDIPNGVHHEDTLVQTNTVIVCGGLDRVLKTNTMRIDSSKFQRGWNKTKSPPTHHRRFGLQCIVV